MNQSDFPIINDPFPPGAGGTPAGGPGVGPGILGDILSINEDDPRAPPRAKLIQNHASSAKL
jgi:hypothetical protein